VKRALQHIEFAQKRKNHLRNGFSRGVLDHGKKTHRWCMVVNAEHLQPGFPLNGGFEVDSFVFHQKTTNHRSDVAREDSQSPAKAGSRLAFDWLLRLPCVHQEHHVQLNPRNAISNGAGGNETYPTEKFQDFISFRRQVHLDLLLQYSANLEIEKPGILIRRVRVT
jgi:hypothetical protein